MANLRHTKPVLTEAFSVGDTSVIDELVAPDDVEHVPSLAFLRLGRA